MVEKQLSDRTNVDRAKTDPSFLIGLLGLDLTALGESKLRRRRCFTAEMSFSVGFGGGVQDLNFLQKFMCRITASSVSISRSDLKISSLTASAQSPQIQRPWYISRIRDMYVGVHSSVNPQHSHFANSNSPL